VTSGSRLSTSFAHEPQVRFLPRPRPRPPAPLPFARPEHIERAQLVRPGPLHL
jgi:hypothetical protein